MPTVPFIPGMSMHLPGCVWQHLARVSAALSAGWQRADLQVLVSCPCSTVDDLLDLGQSLRIFEEAR